VIGAPFAAASARDPTMKKENSKGTMKPQQVYGNHGARPTNNDTGLQRCWFGAERKLR
jgi:hypothetical protein